MIETITLPDKFEDIQMILTDDKHIQVVRGDTNLDPYSELNLVRMFKYIQDLEKEVSDLNTENYHLEDEVSALEAELSQGE